MEKIATFADMPVQRRVEALSAGVANSFPKAISVVTMQPEYPYSVYELFNDCQRSVGSDLPFSPENLLLRARTSLEPAGVVVRGTKVRNDRSVITYTITSDGVTYAKPTVVRALQFADTANLSLTRIHGATNTPGAQRRGYTVYTILEALQDGEGHTTVDLSDRLNISRDTIGQTLFAMGTVGLVDYRSVQVDRWGGSETGYSAARLKNKDKLEEYLRSPEKLKADILNLRSYFGGFGLVSRLLECKTEELTPLTVSQTLGINGTYASTVMGIVCQLEIYGRSGSFEDAFKKSEALISPIGQLMHETLIRPILEVCRNPCDATIGELASPTLDLSTRELTRLLRSEMRRYVEEKEVSSTEEHERKRLHVLGTFSENPEKAVRAKEIVSLSGHKKGIVMAILRELCSENVVERAEPGSYRLKAINPPIIS